MSQYGSQVFDCPAEYWAANGTASAIQILCFSATGEIDGFVVDEQFLHTEGKWLLQRIWTDYVFINGWRMEVRSITNPFVETTK